MFTNRICYLAFGVLTAAISVQAHAANEEPVQLFVSASLKSAMPVLIEASGIPSSHFAAPVYGAGGVLRERLAKGEKADLFASGDMVEPHQLEEAKGKLLVVPFARNQMCMAALPSLGLSTDNMLQKMLQPEVRLATSTVGYGPGGTYSLAVFDRADQVQPGAGEILRKKALQLVGSPNAITPLPGHSPAATIFLSNKADALLYYCSAAPALQKEVEGLASVPLPAALEVHPRYGMAVLSNNPDALRFSLFILSDQGQEILARFGFLPVSP